MGLNSAVGKVSTRQVFLALRSSRLRGNSGPVRITFVGGEEFSRPCVGFAINRKVGGAVVRNRIRRRLRSIFTEASPKLSAGAYLINVTPAAALLSYGELKTNVSAAIANVVERANR